MVGPGCSYHFRSAASARSRCRSPMHPASRRPTRRLPFRLENSFELTKDFEYMTFSVSLFWPLLLFLPLYPSDASWRPTRRLPSRLETSHFELKKAFDEYMTFSLFWPLPLFLFLSIYPSVAPGFEETNEAVTVQVRTRFRHILSR